MTKFSSSLIDLRIGFIIVILYSGSRRARWDVGRSNARLNVPLCSYKSCFIFSQQDIGIKIKCQFNESLHLKFSKFLILAKISFLEHYHDDENDKYFVHNPFSLTCFALTLWMTPNDPATLLTFLSPVYTWMEIINNNVITWTVTVIEQA